MCSYLEHHNAPQDIIRAELDELPGVGAPVFRSVAVEQEQGTVTLDYELVRV